MRQRYGLNYVQISKILSFGPNQYSQYENGQIPSDSNGRILAVVRNKQSMLIFLENARNELGEKEYLALRKSIASSKEDDKDWRIPLFFQGTYKSLNNGYVTPSAEKLEQVVRFFVSREGSVFPTKLNKKLFYADFLHFKHHGQGITGLEYKAVQHGPLPAHYNTIYDNILGIESEIVLSRSMECSKFSCNGFNGSFFQKNELGTLETVAGKCV
jgi:transcriptional regulator with XRE-family HTH domain